jgi:hypothetical protein
MFCIPVLHPYHIRMNSQKPESPHGNWIHAGENLRRLKTSGVYYAFVKRHGKQYRRSLHTTDKAFARRRLADLMRDLERLAPAEDAIRAALSDGEDPRQDHINQHVGLRLRGFQIKELDRCFLSFPVDANLFRARQLFVAAEPFQSISKGPATNDCNGSRVRSLQSLFCSQL